MRMAAGFGATIVPFAAVGEDDLLQLVLDRNALMKIPKLSDHLKDSSRGTVRIRDESSGELRKKKSLIQWFCQIYRDCITICLGCP
ncbi:phytyl ester synthase 1, chloroplastic-like isoform X2 [Malus sylvestris]|uniref:phytyl ester synthase 1, chloroplastic-like isoform X2 n=1 Tax=Malus sylvestris TaxID=3752 RepID=UPI0014603CB9|nr:phytyl ester synthase 1, chloroplastic-like isoform X2 [Malus sylvestris]